MLDFLIAAMVLLWLILAVVYIIRKKKKGECVGCSGGTCTGCRKKHDAN
jgi:hypothetical protein